MKINTTPAAPPAAQQGRAPQKVTRTPASPSTARAPQHVSRNAAVPPPPPARPSVQRAAAPSRANAPAPRPAPHPAPGGVPARQPAGGHGSHGQRAARKRSGKTVPLLLILVDVLLVALLLWHYAPWSVHDVTREVGSALPLASDFVSSDLLGAELVSGLDAGIDMNTVGDHEIVFCIWGLQRRALLHVVDTVAPAVVVRDLETYQHGTVNPEDFLQDVTDATATTAAFAKEPDTSVLGLQQVSIQVSDAGGNKTEVKANLSIVPDTEAPVIDGVKELTVEVGGSVSYKRDVTVTDNCDTDLELQVDNSAVDLNTPGTYPVVYRATDSSGNTAEVSTNLFVITKITNANISEDAVYAAAQQIIANLFPSGLESYSQYDIIYGIYWYCHDQIRYVDSSNKDNWVEAAYNGLVEHQGDCFVYAMSAKMLLEAAGIPNRDIAKIPHDGSMHYWNLVDIGEGWHHFDTTRRADGSTFFYLTDVELMAYSNTHKFTHAYDPGLYTGIVGEDQAEHLFPPGVAPAADVPAVSTQ